MLDILAPQHKEDLGPVYAQHVNRQWVRLVELLGLNKKYIHCEGVELRTDEGETYLDFLSGYGVYNAGHHHPQIKAQLIQEIEDFGPTMLQTHVPARAAELAQRLVKLAGGSLAKVFFTSTGSEGVETAIKFSRCFTKRDWILYGNGGFHGLTCGALSLMSNPWWRDRFGPMLRETEGIAFGDLAALELALKTQKFAAFIIEPIQGESGIVVPAAEYLQRASELCRKYGTLFVLDEVQTGLYRTGKFLAAQHFGVDPDMVILAKAMSGGFVPVGAVLMRSDISDSVYRSMEKSFVHASTFGENALAMRACLATLDVMESQALGANATAMGQRLRKKVNERASKYEMFSEVHGVGLFNGIKFKAPRSIKLGLLFRGLSALHPGLFGQMVVRQLFKESKILTQMCGNEYLVVKAIPPLVVTEQQIDSYVEAIDKLFHGIESGGSNFWSQGIAIGKKAVGF